MRDGRGHGAFEVVVGDVRAGCTFGDEQVGGVLAWGDVLTVLGPDAHTSGGFAVVATVAHAALWKVGQIRPGRDTVRFREIDLDQAAALARHVALVLDDRNYERAGT